MPFITDQLYQRLPKQEKESITIADFPKDTTWLDDNVESQCEKILDITQKY